jgi:hypothetical protein
MASVGYATLDIIPSMKGIESKLQSGLTGPMTSTGTKAGQTLGSSTKKSFLSGIAGIATGLGGLLLATKAVGFLKDSIAQARESQKVTAQTRAVIKSTGGVANVTAKQIGNLANAISLKTGIDDEEIQSSENMLLTFKNVHNEVGKGNDIFNQATQTVTDMSAALGQDAKSSAIQLGKALNDPVKGITALSRVGVTFDDQQKAQITTLVAHNHLLGAQKIILKELTSEFGGSAAAQATAGDKLKVAWGNLEEEIGKALLPMLDKLETWFTTKGIPVIESWVSWFKRDGIDALKSFGGQIGDVVQTLEPLAKGMLNFGKGVFDAFNNLPGPIKKFGAELVIATLAFDAFTKSMVVSKITAWASSIGTAGSRLTALRGAANLAAGGAGLLLLTKSFHKTVTDADVLKEAIGGALTGFSVGGPWGAALGLAAGGFHGIWRQAHAAVPALQNFSGALAKQDPVLRKAHDDTRSYADTIDEATGAITRETRALILHRLQTSGMLGDAHALGIQTRDLIGATLGNVGAMKRVNDQTSRYHDILGAVIGTNLQKWLQENRANLEQTRNAMRQNAKDTQSWKEALQGVPKKVQTRLRQLGFDITMKQLNQLDRQYHLTTRQRNIIMRALGVDHVHGQLKGIENQGHRITKQNPLGLVVTSDIRPAHKGFIDIGKLVSGYGRQKPQATLGVNPKPAQTGAHNLMQLLGSYGKMHPTATLGVNTSAAYRAIAGIRSALNNIPDEQVNVYTHNAGKRAAGGPVAAGMPYIVGERGPELFMSNVNGRIVPNSQLQQATAAAPPTSPTHLVVVDTDGVLMGAMRLAADQRIEAYRSHDKRMAR